MYLLTNVELEVTGKTQYKNKLSGSMYDVLASQLRGLSSVNYLQEG